MLKILFVYYEPISAGQTTHVLALARGLSPRDYCLTIVLPDHLQHSIDAFQQVGVKFVPLRLRKLIWPPGSVRSLACLIRRREIDIVHVHSQEAGMLARVVARLAGAHRIIYTPQVLDIRRAGWHWLYVLVERALAHITDAIVSVNEPDRQRLIEWGVPPHKVVTIPNGIDLDAPVFVGPVDTGELRRGLGLDQDRPLVMQVGRLSPQKAPLAFVEGAALVVREHPNAQFALVGEGPMEDTVTAHIRELGLNGHVQLVGWRADAGRLMTAADVVTLTSQWEGTPHALLEAMAWSRPVVATDVNGCPEIVVDGSTGFLARPGDTATWAGRVIDLLRDPVMASAMGREGRRRVEERFSLREMIDRTEKLYQQVVTDKALSE